MAIKKKSALIHIVALTVVVVVLIVIARPAVSVSTDGAVYAYPYFSEFMTANDSALMDADGDFSKWVELANPTDAPLSLAGMGLTDRAGQEMKWRFPVMSIPPRGHVIIFLSKKNRIDTTGELHTSFGLKDKETLYLLSSDGGVIDELAFASMSGNTSMIRQLGKKPEWEATAAYTPGLPNTQEAHSAFVNARRSAETTVYINEVSPANRTYVQDEDGEYVDWMELRNFASEPVDLSGWALADKPDKPLQWRFPQGTVIEANGYLLVYCSGKNRVDSIQALHTSFSISTASTTLTLANRQGAIVDEVLVQDIPDDASWARESGNAPGPWALQREPTPGLPNTRESVLSIQKQVMANNPGLYISQIISRNRLSYDDGAATPDWMTLRNDTGSDLNLTGYGLSDDPSRPLVWTFPAGSIVRDGQTIAVYTDSLDTVNDSGIHTSFGISRDGETLVLATPERVIIDRVVLPPLEPDIAYLRVAGRDGFFYCEKPVPGEIPETVYDGLLAPPEPATLAGMYASAVVVQPPDVEDGVTVRYTDDGSEPTESSPALTGALTIAKSTVIRTRAFRDGYIASQIATSSYLIGVSHTLPVLSLASDPDGLFSHERGIFAKGPGYDTSIAADKPHTKANYYKGWERATSFEFFDAAGQQTYEQILGIKPHGAFSRERDQKSFSVNARTEYGENRITFNPFDNRDYTEYKNFVLRTSSQDDNRARMRDAVLTEAMAKGTGVAYQSVQPVIVYINGEYFGHYNLRERVNHWMIANFEGITDPEIIARINVLEGNGTVDNGTAEGWKEIMEFLKNNRLTSADNLRWIDERIDIENYFNYAIMEIWCANSDTGNIRWYQVPGGKWKWILYDLDWAMNRHNSVVSSDMCGEHWDNLTWYTKEKGHGVGASFSTLLIRRLLEVPALREQFVEQLAHLMNTNLNEQNIRAHIDAFAEQLAPEMPAHFERWSYQGSVSSWEKNVDRLREWLVPRNAKMMADMKRYFDLSSARMNELFPNGTP